MHGYCTFRVNANVPLLVKVGGVTVSPGGGVTVIDVIPPVIGTPLTVNEVALIGPLTVSPVSLTVPEIVSLPVTLRLFFSVVVDELYA
jgi:hypothetical protein